MITKELVDGLFKYKNGELFWKVKKGTKYPGDMAGTVNSYNYKVTQINRKLYLNHRIIFLMHYGYLPKVVDHIDGNTTNNKIKNLREATFHQNLWNAKLSAKNTSGIKGVSMHKKSGLWRASCMVNGERKVKYFKSKDDAKGFITSHRKELHGAFKRDL